MNKLKTIASAIALTMAFFSSATAKVAQNADIATTSVSEIACQYMQQLVDLGLVQLPAGCRDVRSSHFTRDEMADLTLQAMSHLGMDVYGNINGTRVVHRSGIRETLALRSELYKDLQNKGMIDDPTLLTDLSPSSEASDEKKMKNGNIESVVKYAITTSNIVAMIDGVGGTANFVAGYMQKAALMTIGMSSV